MKLIEEVGVPVTANSVLWQVLFFFRFRFNQHCPRIVIFLRKCQCQFGSFKITPSTRDAEITHISRVKVLSSKDITATQPHMSAHTV